MTSLRALKEAVFEANLELVRQNLVIYTFGNVSGIDRERNLVVIKPSGVDYDTMRPEDMVVVSLAGERVEGELNPSSDLETHLVLYRAFPTLGGVAHTHSRMATAWAQAGRGIPCYGTTQADYCHGEIPCTRPMTGMEIASDYEANTGLVIVERFKGEDASQYPGVLVFSHGPFSWGKDPAEAVYHATVMEYVADMARVSEQLTGGLQPMSQALLDKHYFRKHGANAYYGQVKRK